MKRKLHGKKSFILSHAHYYSSVFRRASPLSQFMSTWPFVYNVMLIYCNVMPIGAMASLMTFCILFYVCNIICSLLYLFLKEISVLFSSHLFVQFNVENATLFGALLDVIQMLE